MKKEIAVNITQQAVDKAKELVSLDSSSIGLRIEIKKGGCSGMTYDVVPVSYTHLTLPTRLPV